MYEENFSVDFGEVVKYEGTSDFNTLVNRPSYNGQEMTGETNIPKVPAKVSELQNDSDYQTGTEVSNAVSAEASLREQADTGLQNQIDDIKNSPDVVDIVPTYAALQAYDTSKLGNNDIIRVLADETHDGQSTYYRWNATTSTWTYVGAVGDYYTKSQVDKVLGELDAAITHDNLSEPYTADKISVGWEIGGINFASGNTTTGTTRIRTKDYILEDITRIVASSDVLFGLLAYNNGTYVGCWNGSSFTTSTSWISEADVDLTLGYNYKIAIRDAASTSTPGDLGWADDLTCYNSLADITTDLDTKFSGQSLVNNLTTLDDCNNAIINRYYSINITNLPNAPVAEKGHLLYFGLKGGTTTVQSGREMQMYFTHSGDMYYRVNRFSSGAPWGNWRKVTTEINDPLPTLSMFESIGVIGDSFASGEIYDAQAGTHADYYNVSWGQIMARMSGTVAVNYSKGGLTSKTWLTDSDYGLAKLNSEAPNDLYVIALGINDANKLTLGTIDDIESDDTDTFYSYYGRVVRAIRAHAPNAIIILSTLARFGTNYNNFSDAIKAIGNYYSFPVLDLFNSDFFQSAFFTNNQISNHPVAISYAGMAKEYKKLIEQALEDNVALYDTYTGGSATMPKLMNDVLKNIVAGASPYSTTASYAVGDYCIYDTKLYQCNTAIVGGEAWTVGHWDLVPSLQEQLDNDETWEFDLSDSTTVTKKVVVR